jgi:DNA repair exonuclease SbcCD ATPase subunit
MNTFTKLARLALAVGLGSNLIVGGALAQPGNQEQALRELNIMRNIFRASLETENGRGFGPGSADALYLANQGMVFTFDMPGRGWLNMPAALAKLQSLGGDFDLDFDFDSEVYVDGDGNGGDAASSEYQQQMREYNEAMRDHQNEMRDLQREMRNLQREQRDSDTDNDSEIDRLNAEMEAVGEQIQQLGDSINEAQQAYDTERRQQLAAVQQAYATRLFRTLCDYGTTLRSLSSGEHVSLVLRNHEDNESTVYVVDYAALASCSSAESLQQGAVSYVQSMR